MTEFTISHPNVKKQQSYAQEGKQLIINALTLDEEAKGENDLQKRLKVLHSVGAETNVHNSQEVIIDIKI